MQNWWQTQQPHFSSDNEEDCPDYNMRMNRRNTSSRSGAFSQQPHRRSNQPQPPPPPLDGASVALSSPAASNATANPPVPSSSHSCSSHWPQLAKQRASLRSPTLPDGELNSMLQNYLDEKYRLIFHIQIHYNTFYLLQNSYYYKFCRRDKIDMFNTLYIHTKKF